MSHRLLRLMLLVAVFPIALLSVDGIARARLEERRREVARIQTRADAERISVLAAS